MRKLLLVLAALLVTLSIFSTRLWRNLQTERLTGAALSTQLASATSVAAVPELPAQSFAVPPPATTPDCPAVPVAPAPATVQMVDFLLTQALGLSGSTSMIGEKDLAKDPVYRKAQLIMLRKRLARTNPGLAEALRLSDAEADHILDVMAEAQLTSMISSDPTAALADALRRASATGDPLRTALGEARFAQLQDYQRNIRPALTTVEALGDILTSAGQPISDSQSRTLTAALLAEQQRQRQEPAVPQSAPSPGAPRDTMAMLEDSTSRLDDANRWILAAAASSLSAAQQQALRDRFDQQASSRRGFVDTARRALMAPQQLPVPQGMK